MHIDDLLAGSSYDSVLEVLDEYTLYAFYLRPLLGDDPVIQQHYHSPLHKVEDGDRNHPSFVIFPARKWANREYAWTDHRLNLKGDIFDLVQHMYGLETRRDAMRKITGDHGLGQAVEVERVVLMPKQRKPVKIDIKSRPFKSHELDYWAEGGVRRETLTRYHTTAPVHYWVFEDQEAPFYPRGMMFAYRIGNCYQLYRPHAKKENGECKFVACSWNEWCLPGFAQLQYRHDTLIINKACKDMMVMEELGIADNVSYRGENVPIPELFWQHFRERYKRIIICVDNDGKAKRPLQDGCSMIYMPQGVAKDPDELVRGRGQSELLHYMQRSMGIVADMEQALTQQYVGKCVTIHYHKLTHNREPATGKVDRMAVEVLGNKTNIVFILQSGAGLNRCAVQDDELEIVQVY